LISLLALETFGWWIEIETKHPIVTLAIQGGGKLEEQQKP
jgi:hypothetical protein